MTSVAIDRAAGARTSRAIKAPVRCASTANLTLSGEQTVDGVALVTGDRILVKNQTSGIDNGIYVVDTSTWDRAPDCSSNSDWTRGTLVESMDGATTTGLWYLTTTGTIVIGTTSLTFTAASFTPATLSAFMQTVLAAADATTAFKLLSAAALSATGDISPAVLAANTDDWAPVGFATASTIRASSSAAINLTGIAAGTDGRLLMLHNVGTFAITLKDDATSTAANRFQMNGDYPLNPDASVLLEYDSTSSRWRIFGQQSTQASVSFNRLLNNVGLAVTMAGNAVTIALKAADGTDPTAVNPALINFRSGTITLGTVNQRTVQAATSVAISSTSTAGTVSAQASRIWIAAIDVGGTVELAWMNALSGSGGISGTGFTIAIMDENQLITTVAEGGAGAADSAGVWYSTTARANVAFTVLGYFESTQATAGTWATAASKLVVNPEARPGKVLQTVQLRTTTATTGTTTTPFDNTPPQSGEGDQYMTQSITPSAACNLIRARVDAMMGASTAITAILACFQDATASCFATTWSPCAAGGVISLHLETLIIAGGVAATAIKTRIGGQSGTITFNGSGAAAELGATLATQTHLEELMA